MNDKIFDLLEKMYIEFSEFKKDTNEKFDNIDKKFDNMDNRFTKIEINIENNVGKKIEALYDGYKQIYEKVNENNEKLTEISNKVQKQEVEIKVIQGGKR